MGARLESLTDDELYTAFAEADEQGDDRSAELAAAEILKRCGDPLAPVVHDVPGPLHWLPRLFWHQKPGGAGGGGG